jgi:hypothetical protein
MFSYHDCCPGTDLFRYSQLLSGQKLIFLMSSASRDFILRLKVSVFSLMTSQLLILFFIPVVFLSFSSFFGIYFARLESKKSQEL